MNTTSQGNEEPCRTIRNHRAPHPQLKIRKILVAYDFSEPAHKAMDYAIGLAEQFGSMVVLLHVVEPAHGSENYMAAPALDQTSEHLLEASRERLEQASHKRIGHRVPAETLARIGHAHSEITDTALALGADLIVMGTHGHSGVRRVLLGSTAEKVLRHAPCPVLTIREG